MEKRNERKANPTRVQRENIMELKTLFKDKDILLVGNSKTLIEKDYSKQIDSYEFVVRFNYALRHYTRFDTIGTKLDAWVCGIHEKKLNIIEELWKESLWLYNQKGISAPPENVIRYGENSLNLGKNNFCLKKSKLEKEIKFSAPSTGIATIYYILNYCKPKSLSIIGFDSFKRTNFYASRRTNHKHSIEYEQAYITKMIKEGYIDNLTS
jgi:hypothetical protein